MDLSKFDVSAAASAGADLQLKHPATGEHLFCSDGSPFVVRVVGNDAPNVKEAFRRIKEKRAKGNLPEEQAAQEMIAVCIAGWSDEMTFDGKPFKYSADNALKLAQDERTAWIAEQIAPFALSRRNFAQNMT
jgi:hypothetical protein